MSYPNWTHEKNCNQKDPINLISSYDVDTKEIIKDLEKLGWHNTWFKNDHYLPNPSNPYKKIKQVAQRVHGHIFARYHIRLWKHNNIAIGSVHFETGSLSGRHIVHTFESAEKKVSIDLNKSNWQIDDDDINLNNFIHFPYNNGLATKISRKRGVT